MKRLRALLIEWQARDSATRRRGADRAGRGIRGPGWLFAGNLVGVRLPEPVKPAAPTVASGAGGTRKVLIHYHLFKNAGTSVDAILRPEFRPSLGRRRVSAPGPGLRRITQEAVRRLILDNPNLATVSSHTLMLLVPEIEGVEVFPILFVRPSAGPAEIAPTSSNASRRRRPFWRLGAGQGARDAPPAISRRGWRFGAIVPVATSTCIVWQWRCRRGKGPSWSAR